MTFILTTALERSANRNLPAPLSEAVSAALEHLRRRLFSAQPVSHRFGDAVSPVALK